MGEKKLSVKLLLNDKEFKTGLRKNSKRLKDLGKSMQETGRNLSVNFTLPILAAGAASVKMASDYEESLNKTRVAFGESSASVEAFSKTTLTSFGIAEGSALEMASLFGDMSTSMGLNQETAGAMSTSLVGLAGDLASFKNIGIEQAQTALAGIFTGEAESLKKLGVIITEANLKQFGYNKTMSETEKIGIRYKAVMAQTANAQGDYINTSDGLANATRTLQESIKELAVDLGDVIMPLALALTSRLQKLVNGFKGLSDGTKKTIIVIAGIVAAIGPAVFLFGKLATVAGAAAKALRFVNAVMRANPIGLLITAIALAVGAIIFLATSSSDMAVNVRNAFRTMVNGVIMFLNQLIAAANKIPRIDIPFIDFLEKEKPAEKIAETAKAVDNLAASTFDLDNALGKLGKTNKKKPFEFTSVKSKGASAVDLPGVDGSKAPTMAKIEMPEIENTESGAFGMSDDYWENMAGQVQNFGQIAGEVWGALSESMESFYARQMENVEIEKNDALLKLEREHGYTAMLLEEDKKRFNSMSAQEKREFKLKADFEKRKLAIEEDAAKKSRAILRKQAKMNKATMALNAAVNTAAGITAALASANVPLSVAIGIAGAAQVANIIAAPLPALADGGIAFGQSIVNVGEYSGASVNPEVIAPLSKLQSLMGGSSVEVYGTISGEDIVLSSRRYEDTFNRIS